MIKTIVQPRRSGKTTSIITRMEIDKELICIVSSEASQREYPKDLHKRLINMSSPFFYDYIAGANKNSRFIIDEGYTLSKDKLAELYYSLGRCGIDVEVVGTIKEPEYQLG